MRCGPPTLAGLLLYRWLRRSGNKTYTSWTLFYFKNNKLTCFSYCRHEKRLGTSCQLESIEAACRCWRAISIYCAFICVFSYAMQAWHTFSYLVKDLLRTMCFYHMQTTWVLKLTSTPAAVVNPRCHTSEFGFAVRAPPRPETRNRRRCHFSLDGMNACMCTPSPPGRNYWG